MTQEYRPKLTKEIADELLAMQKRADEIARSVGVEIVSITGYSGIASGDVGCHTKGHPPHAVTTSEEGFPSWDEHGVGMIDTADPPGHWHRWEIERRQLAAEFDEYKAARTAEAE